jgi:serine/threonine protein kinase
MNSDPNCAFLTALKESHLLTDEQFVLARRMTAECREASGLARELVRRGWLTSWQVRKLEEGHRRFRCADYTLLDVLGRGNMGIVYKAQCCHDHALVALKVMPGRAASSKRQSARFRREIRLATAVRSPHVVRALDSGSVADRDFLVMEFIEGRTFDWWIKANQRLPVPWACECARQTAIGLQHVHECGLIHRDIKPSNIIVSGDSLVRRPRVRILDLGLGRFTGPVEKGDDLTRDGHTVGTLDYMAPEQLQDNRMVDIRSDIYALGCTLFEALTGRQPFEGNDLSERVLAKLTREPTSINEFREDAPAELAELVIQMMSRAPEARPAIPRDAAESLRPFSIRAPGDSGTSKRKSPSKSVRTRLPKTLPLPIRRRGHVTNTARTVASGLLNFLGRIGLIRWGNPRAVE